MDRIIKLYFCQRIDQICKSQSVPTGETTLSAESIDISQEFLEVLNISIELKNQRATSLLDKKDLVATTESKIDMLFQNIITSETEEKNAKIDDIIALAMTYYNIGLVYTGTKQLQDLVISEAHFTKCMILLKEKEFKRNAILTIIRVLHELHTISYIQGQLEKSYSFLNTAMELYSKYTKEKIEYPNSINFVDMGDEKNPNSMIILENLQAITLQNMSNLYKENYRDKHEFVTYIHYILNQLTERTSYISSEYYVYWAITSSDLSQYFVHNYRFTEARNHLIAAEYMMKEFQEKVMIKAINEEYDKYIFLYRCKKTGDNSVIKSWGLYGAKLLVASTNVLLQREEDNKSFDTDNSKSESPMDSKEDLTKLLIFTDKKKNFENFTARFPDKYVSNFDEAKAIFLDVLKCFDTVKEYFTIEEYPVDFVNIKIATSKVYKCLATFEQDRGSQLKLYSRQTTVMKLVCHELDKISFKSFCSSLMIPMVAKISSEMMVGHIILLDMITDYLRLNVEKLNTKFINEINLLRIDESVRDIVCSYRFAIGCLDALEKFS